MRSTSGIPGHGTQRSGAADRLRFLQWLSGDDLRAAYAASDVCVTPSMYREPFNLVNIEAMAARKPVVTTCFGGPPEVVVDGVTGYVVDPRDVGLFSARLETLLTGEDFARAWAKPATSGYWIISRSPAKPTGSSRSTTRSSGKRTGETGNQSARQIGCVHAPGTSGHEEDDASEKEPEDAKTRGRGDAGSGRGPPVLPSSFRILHLITSLDVGGAQRHLLRW